MDRIGSLPEEVLCHILSFLTTKEAALTSILSKRWRNLFTLVPHLDIDDSVFLYPEEGKREREGILESFMDFVDRVLASQGDSPIKKFSLKCKTGIDTDRVNHWICNVLGRGVTNLELILDFPRSDDDDLDYMYFLPDELFVSSKLVELNLRSEFGVDWWRGGRGTFLPMLKTLTFDSKWILLCDELEVFLSAFPVLEEFYMAEIEWDSDESVSSESLRKLTIYTSGFEDFRIEEHFLIKGLRSVNKLFISAETLEVSCYFLKQRCRCSTTSKFYVLSVMRVWDGKRCRLS
ncbi:hypothetical protein Bca52824_034748 [Brassica carinata]|uniref:F-box domain-containing protein n=1 Tax=Brassica carinata TaxID=52824 RepID=A0A8X7V227_BRACI|nr:hypothetical protein Bca52824_034748 [Brassica carinata]